MTNVPTQYTLGSVDSYSSGGGWYHAQMQIDLVDYMGYTGSAYLLVSIPDVVAELAICKPDPDEPNLASFYEDDFLAELFPKELKGTQFADLYLKLLEECADFVSDPTSYRLFVPMGMGLSNKSDQLTLTEYLRLIKKYFKGARGVKASTHSCADTKYLANMVSASSFDSAYDENDELYEFHVAGYLQKSFVGLMEDWYTNDFEEALEHASEMGTQGLYVRIENQIDGRYRTVTPDEWEEAAEYGEYPDYLREDIAL